MTRSAREPDQPTAARHVPVLLREAIEQLDLKPGQTIVDGTVGAGGHSRAILERIGPSGRLVGLDRDPMMLRLAARQLADANCQLHHASYADLPDLLAAEKTAGVDAVLLDLGVASEQLADDSRGFSFGSDGPLDLRFDRSAGEPAWRCLERVREADLVALLREFGEERFARRIARRIVWTRQQQPIRTAAQLAEIARRAIPPPARRSARRHPATRLFQALRIAVNEELDHLARALDHALFDCLSPGGRLVVISFHSLEDRLVKTAFRDRERWQNLTPKPLTPSLTERQFNPRSRSAKLRAALRRPID